MRGNHPLLWSVFFSGDVPAHERGWSQRRRRRRKFRLLCKRMCLIAKREIWAWMCQSFMKHSQACAHRNACSSFPWRGRAGWPSGSSARPRSSSPGVKHSVVIVLRSIKKTHERARIPSGTANVPLHGPTLTIMIIIENPHQQAWNTVLVCAGLGVRCHGWHRPTSRGRVLVHYYTLLSVHIILPEHNPGSAVCLYECECVRGWPELYQT